MVALLLPVHYAPSSSALARPHSVGITGFPSFSDAPCVRFSCVICVEISRAAIPMLFLRESGIENVESELYS